MLYAYHQQCSVHTYNIHVTVHHTMTYTSCTIIPDRYEVQLYTTYVATYNMLHVANTFWNLVCTVLMLTYSQAPLLLARQRN